MEIDQVLDILWKSAVEEFMPVYQRKSRSTGVTQASSHQVIREFFLRLYPGTPISSRDKAGWLDILQNILVMHLEGWEVRMVYHYYAYVPCQPLCNQDTKVNGHTM